MSRILISLRTALAQGCAFALLTDAGPSCGSLQVYSGHHVGTRRAGHGVVAEHLNRHGIAVFAPSQIAALATRLGCHPLRCARSRPKSDAAPRIARCVTPPV